MLERPHRDTLSLVRLSQRAIRRTVDYRINNSSLFKTDRQFVLAVRRAVTIKIERAHQSPNGPGTLAGRCFPPRLLAPRVWLIYLKPRVVWIYRVWNLESQRRRFKARGEHRPGPKIDCAPRAERLAHQQGQFSQARQTPFLFPVHMNALPGVSSKASELKDASQHQSLLFPESSSSSRRVRLKAACNVS